MGQAAAPHVVYENTTVWAARTALQDAKTLPPDIASRARYVFLRGGTRDELASIGFLVNSTLSRVNVPIVPGTSPGCVVLAGGRLVRLDLGVLATDADDLANLVATWEKLAGLDTDFGATITEKRVVKIPRTKINGKFYTSQWRLVTTRFQAPAEAIELSAVLGGTACPIIDGRQLMTSALTTLEGGLYYRFRGIASDATLKGYLQSRGASEEQVAALESLEKAVVLHSGVTAKERMVSVFRGAGVRASAGGGIVAITFDPFDEDRDPSRSAVRNLLEFRGRGSEVILELSNGFHEWTLWDAAGKLVKVAPPNLASDHRIPEPHTRQLQPGISCLRCHGPEDGWRGLTNDVPKILAAGTDIFGDLSAPEDRLKSVQLLAGLYSGDWFEAGIGPLAVGRLTYDRAVFQCTGRGADAIASTISAQFDGFAYQLLDVWDVAAELGIEGLPASDNDPATDDDVRAACEALRVFIGAAPVDGAIAREDAIISSVLAGIPVSRRSWQSAAHLAYERCYSRGLQ